MTSGTNWMALFQGNKAGATLEENLQRINAASERIKSQLTQSNPSAINVPQAIETINASQRQNLEHGANLAIDSGIRALPLRDALVDSDARKENLRLHRELEDVRARNNLGQSNVSHLAQTQLGVSLPLAREWAAIGRENRDATLGGASLKYLADQDNDFRNRQLAVGQELANKRPGFMETVSGLAPIGLMIASLLGGRI
jgi:hypothetical protein